MSAILQRLAGPPPSVEPLVNTSRYMRPLCVHYTLDGRSLLQGVLFFFSVQCVCMLCVVGIVVCEKKKRALLVGVVCSKEVGHACPSTCTMPFHVY